MSRKSIRLKIFLARLLVVVMVVTSIPFYQKQEAKAAGNLLWPVSGGKLGCGFNCSCATHRGYHNGIDINGVPEGTSIMAAESGVVICSNNTTSGRTEKCNRGCQGQGNGHHVEIKHANGMITQYNHMSRCINWTECYPWTGNRCCWANGKCLWGAFTFCCINWWTSYSMVRYR